MRKISDYVGKQLILAADGAVLGQITGVMCDNRLKSVEFLTFTSDNAENNKISGVMTRNLKQNDDKSIVLSSILCIKNTAEIEASGAIAVSPQTEVYDSRNNLIGNVSDIYFAETKKAVEGVLVNSGVILPERIDTLCDGKIALLPEGRKRRSSARAVKSVQTAENYAVEVLPEPFPPTPLAVSLPAVAQDEDVAENAAQTDDIIDTAPEVALSPSAEPARVYNPLPNKFIGNYRFLLGRVVTSNIYNLQRKLIIKAGTLITAEVVLTAHKNNLLVDLTLYSRA